MVLFSFNPKPKPLRIVRRTRQVWYPGYLCPFEETTQYLMDGDIVLDSEIVPEDVLITLACCGDTGGWLSKWAGSHPQLFQRAG